MSGYVKKIALIKGMKSGFSADGGELSGLVKCESYAGFLKVEEALINFAPLSEGRYVSGISDGKNIYTFEGEVYERECEFDLSRGCACLICFCHNGVFPIASAVSGNCGGFLKLINAAICSQEGNKKEAKDAAYEDEAIAEVNYYEFENIKGDGALRENEKKEKDMRERKENENDTGAIKAQAGRDCEGNELNLQNNKTVQSADFYESKKKEIEKIFALYPKDEKLERAIEGSRWAKISYGDGLYYSFGAIYYGGNVKYLCYGVPAYGGENGENVTDNNLQKPPKSLEGRASFISVDGGGYWVMYQDAATGKAV